MSKGKKLHWRSVRPSSADSTTVPPVSYIEKTEVTVSDRMLVSIGPARPVRWSSKSLALVSDWMLVSVGPDRPISSSRGRAASVS